MRVLYQHPSWGYRDAVNVWGVTPAEDKFAVANAGIDAMEKFFRSIVLPMTLAEFKIDDSRFEEMAVKAVEVGHLDGAHVPLNEKDVVEILTLCMYYVSGKWVPGLTQCQDIGIMKYSIFISFIS